ELQKEADARERGLHQLTVVIADREARIAELKGVAEEHLRRLENMQANFSQLQRQGDARERELSQWLGERNARIEELGLEIEKRTTELKDMSRQILALEN